MAGDYWGKMFTNSSDASSIYLYADPPEGSAREPFDGEMLRERYADDPVALAMIEYIEELLDSNTYKLRLDSTPIYSSGTTTTSTTPMKLTWGANGTASFEEI